MSDVPRDMAGQGGGGSEHAWVHENLGAYVAGGMEAAERSRLDGHVNGCVECFDAFTEARDADRLMQRRLGSLQPGGGPEGGAKFEERVTAAVRERAMERWKTPSLALRGLYAVAACAALAATGAFAQFAIRQDFLNNPLSEQLAERADSSAPELNSPLASVGYRSRPAATGAPMMNFNFQNQSAAKILDEMSEKFGLDIIQPPNPIPGNLTISVPQPVNREQALALMNDILTPLGYTTSVSPVLGSDRKLVRVGTVPEIKKASNPVYEVTSPGSVPAGDQLITAVIPLKNVQAVKLRNDLSPLMSADADVAANVGSNTLVVTDTATKVRRLAEIVDRLDKPLVSASGQPSRGAGGGAALSTDEYQKRVDELKVSGSWAVNGVHRIASGAGDAGNSKAIGGWISGGDPTRLRYAPDSPLAKDPSAPGSPPSSDVRMWVENTVVAHRNGDDIGFEFGTNATRGLGVSSGITKSGAGMLNLNGGTLALGGNPNRPDIRYDWDENDSNSAQKNMQPGQQGQQAGQGGQGQGQQGKLNFNGGMLVAKAPVTETAARFFRMEDGKAVLSGEPVVTVTGGGGAGAYDVVMVPVSPKAFMEKTDTVLDVSDAAKQARAQPDSAVLAYRDGAERDTLKLVPNSVQHGTFEQQAAGSVAHRSTVPSENDVKVAERGRESTASERTARVANLVSDANKLYQSTQFAEAADLLRQAEVIDPQNENGKLLRALVEDKIAAKSYQKLESRQGIETMRQNVDSLEHLVPPNSPRGGTVGMGDGHADFNRRPEIAANTDNIPMNVIEQGAPRPTGQPGPVTQPGPPTLQPAPQNPRCL